MYAVDFNKYCHLTSSLPDSEDLEPEDRPEADQDVTSPMQRDDLGRGTDSEIVAQQSLDNHEGRSSTEPSGVLQQNVPLVREEHEENDVIPSEQDPTSTERTIPDHTPSTEHPASIESAAGNQHEGRNVPEATSGEKHSRVEIIEEHFGNLVYFRVPFDITSKTGSESNQVYWPLCTEVYY